MTFLLAMVAVATLDCRRTPRKPTGRTFFDDATPVVKAFSSRFSAKTEVCQITVYPRDIRVTVKAAGGKVEAFRLDQRYAKVRPFPKTSCWTGPKRPLSDSVFPLSSVDLSLIPSMVADAHKRLGGGSSDEISRLMLQRPIDLSNGAPRWTAYSLTSTRQIVFDLKGKFVTRVDAHGRPLDGVTFDYFKDASTIPKTIEKRLGADFVLTEIRVFRTLYKFEGKQKKPDAKLERYEDVRGEFKGPLEGAPGPSKVLDENLFELSHLDWSLVPKLAADAAKRYGVAGVGPSYVEAQRGRTRPGLTWTVYLQRDLTHFEYDAKGQFLGRKDH